MFKNYEANNLTLTLNKGNLSYFEFFVYSEKLKYDSWGIYIRKIK